MPNKDGKKLTGMQLFRILIDISNNDKSNVIISDEFRSYEILYKTEESRFNLLLDNCNGRITYKELIN